MKTGLPPVAPKGSASVMKAYNELRQYIIERQLAGVQGDVDNVSLIITPSGRLASWMMVGGAPTTTGACCIGVTCSSATEAACIAAGGIFHGAGVPCTPGLCDGGLLTGACCITGECSIRTSVNCASLGGVYYGDGSLCIPNPCGMLPPCCGGAYVAFDGSGRRFHTQTTTYFKRRYESVGGSCPPCVVTGVPPEVLWEVSFVTTGTYDPVLCVGSSSCTGYSHHYHTCLPDEDCSSGDCSYCWGAGDLVFQDISGFTTETTTATTHHISGSHTFPGSGCDFTIDRVDDILVELSGECLVI